MKLMSTKRTNTPVHSDRGAAGHLRHPRRQRRNPALEHDQAVLQGRGNAEHAEPDQEEEEQESEAEKRAFHGETG
jgi:hypothetical protein